MKSRNDQAQRGFTLVVCLTVAVAARAAVYDLGHTFVEDQGLSEIRGKISTSRPGTFTNEQDIEDFLNTTIYSLQAFAGTTLVFTLNNANSAWDLELGGSGTSAVMVNSPTALTAGLSTTEETTDVTLLLRSEQIDSTYEFLQSNNVSDENSLFVDSNLILVGFSPLPYDSPLVFPAVPEPSSAQLGFVSLAVLCLRLTQMKNRKSERGDQSMRNVRPWRCFSGHSKHQGREDALAGNSLEPRGRNSRLDVRHGQGGPRGFPTGDDYFGGEHRGSV